MNMNKQSYWALYYPEHCSFDEFQYKFDRYKNGKTFSAKAIRAYFDALDEDCEAQLIGEIKDALEEMTFDAARKKFGCETVDELRQYISTKTYASVIHIDDEFVLLMHI